MIPGSWARCAAGWKFDPAEFEDPDWPDPMVNHGLRLIDWRAERRRRSLPGLARTVLAELGRITRLALGVGLGILASSLIYDWLLFTGRWPFSEGF